MSKIKRISECPMCGGNVQNVDPTSITENKCPYCGYELYNHSKEYYDEKIEDIKEAKSKLISTQLIIAVIAIAFVLIAGVIVVNRVAYRQTDQYHLDASDKITKKMNKAYAKEDWDTLYEMTIENPETGLKSPYYFSFRAAWLLSYYVPLFNEACDNNDTEMMKDAYYQIGREYSDRNGLAETFKFIPEIEDKLEAEYLREKEIMIEKGLAE